MIIEATKAGKPLTADKAMTGLTSRSMGRMGLGPVALAPDEIDPDDRADRDDRQGTRPGYRREPSSPARR